MGDRRLPDSRLEVVVKITEQRPPRQFVTGRGEPIVISDCARILLEPDEQVTFVTASGAEYDVSRKAWGFYATPSINGRLLNFGLRAVLIRNYVGKYYVMLVERGSEGRFEEYVRVEQNTIVRWLDNEADLAQLSGPSAGTQQAVAGNDVHCMCGADRFSTVHMYFAPPEGEVRFSRHAAGAYRREVFRCSLCGHFVSVHDMDDAGFYEGDYVDATYGNSAGLRAHFDRIVGLPAAQSDNAGRVRRVSGFARDYLQQPSGNPSVLDVGSGLCVFLHGMKGAGWSCTALDPDERAVQHARDVVGVAAIRGDFMTADDLGRYQLITFNKVLEHLKDPIAMLARAARYLARGGLVYVELPDGEAAATEGFGREEFFVEHYHVFSAASIATLAARAGFEVLLVERLREPSSKYTLRAFLRLPLTEGTTP
jgi:SAM-dependent methyltransferase